MYLHCGVVLSDSLQLLRQLSPCDSSIQPITVLHTKPVQLWSSMRRLCRKYCIWGLCCFFAIENHVSANSLCVCYCWDKQTSIAIFKLKGNYLKSDGTPKKKTQYIYLYIQYNTFTGKPSKTCCYDVKFSVWQEILNKCNIALKYVTIRYFWNFNFIPCVLRLSFLLVLKYFSAENVCYSILTDCVVFKWTG